MILKLEQANMFHSPSKSILNSFFFFPKVFLNLFLVSSNINHACVRMVTKFGGLLLVWEDSLMLCNILFHCWDCYPIFPMCLIWKRPVSIKTTVEVDLEIGRKNEICMFEKFMVEKHSLAYSPWGTRWYVYVQPDLHICYYWPLLFEHLWHIHELGRNIWTVQNNPGAATG